MKRTIEFRTKKDKRAFDRFIHEEHPEVIRPPYPGGVAFYSMFGRYNVIICNNEGYKHYWNIVADARLNRSIGLILKEI